jgi:hypothetical protein
LKWIDIRIGSGPDAGSLGKLVAIQALGAAVPDDARVPVGDKISREYQMGFERNFLIYMITITSFTNFPDAISHDQPPFRIITNKVPINFPE